MDYGVFPLDLRTWRGPSVLTCALAAALWCSVAGELRAQFNQQQPANQQPATQQQLQLAIDRAIAYLKKGVSSSEDAHASVMTLALLKAGVPETDPSIAGTLARAAGRFDTAGKFLAGQHGIYDAGVTLMALANANPQKYRRQIDAIVEYIVSNQCPNGSWDYMQPYRQLGDTSITQYAILGLWEAARTGATVPQQVWDRAAAWHIAQQRPDGSFVYHPLEGSGATHTMTVAGTASLYVARLHMKQFANEQPDPVDTARNRKGNGRKFGVLVAAPLDEAEEEVELSVVDRLSDPKYKPTVGVKALDGAIKRGQLWIAEKYSTTPQTPWQLYYLYGIERLTALADLNRIADHDWYAEGSDLLARRQDENGAWNDQCGEQAATSFGLMFLVKATAKAMHRIPRDPRFGGGLLIGGRGLPDNLMAVQVGDQGVKVRKIKGAVDELLAELENPQSQEVQAAQTSIVDTVQAENPEALVGQTDRLLKLLGDRRVEVRRTALWALGRTNNLRVVPRLIEGLKDPDLSCVIEARNALRFVSKRLNENEPPDEPTEVQRASAIAHWRKWYINVRPYDERDDLLDPSTSR